jgi:hypothetical protein
MNAGDKREGIYVPLDVLLDTRLGTLALIDPELPAKALANNYHHRRDDNFPGIDSEKFKEAYKQRTWETLANSTITNAVMFIKHLASLMNEQAVSRPYHDGVKITINTYPYILTTEERVGIQAAVSFWLGGTAPVDVINIPLHELTPSFCKARFSLMFMYDYEEWMEVQANAFQSVRIPDITLFVPALYFNKTPTDSELETVTRDGAHPQMAIEMLASPLVELRLIAVEYFSITRQSRK